MNKYEEKFKKTFEYALKVVESRKQEIINLKADIECHANKIHSLTQSIEILSSAASSDAIAVLDKICEELNGKIANAKSRIFQCERWLDEDMKRVSILKAACPHVNTEFDHTDYHKNEDFHRCLLCGDIF